MSLDCKVLIQQVKERPALWDREDRFYCLKQIVTKLWAEIALTHGVHESKVKNKWKALRDTFRQELKKNNRKSTWSYYKDMLFLKGQLKTLPSSSKPGFEDDLDNVTVVKTEFENIKSEDESLGDDLRCRSMDVEPDSEMQQTLVDLDSDDYHFLMSLLPEMRRLDPRQKMLLRIRIMELFYKVVYRKEF